MTDTLPFPLEGDRALDSLPFPFPFQVGLPGGENTGMIALPSVVLPLRLALLLLLISLKFPVSATLAHGLEVKLMLIESRRSEGECVWESDNV